MKKMVGKSDLINKNLPCKFVVNNTEIFEEKQIAKEFNNFFTNVWPELANEIHGAVTSVRVTQRS